MENTGAASQAAIEMPWRTGRHLGRTIYAQVDVDGGPGRLDVVLGMVDSVQLAEHIVVLHNAWLEGELR